MDKWLACILMKSRECHKSSWTLADGPWTCHSWLETQGDTGVTFLSIPLSLPKRSFSPGLPNTEEDTGWAKKPCIHLESFLLKGKSNEEWKLRSLRRLVGTIQSKETTQCLEHNPICPGTELPLARSQEENDCHEQLSPFSCVFKVY